MADNMNATVRDPFASRRQTPPIVIGRAGEYGATTVTFDLRGLIDRYGAGTPSLLHKRPPDDEAYIVPPSATDTETHDWVEMPDAATLVWHVGQVATSYVGNGTIELQWRLPGTTSKKTAQFDVVVLGAIGNPASEIPNAQQIYVDAMQEIADRAEGFVENAREAAACYPKIVNGHWFVWDVNEGTYVDTGFSAQGDPGDDGVSPTVQIGAVQTGNMTGHSVTITDAEHPSGQRFVVMDGAPGADGHSPYVNSSGYWVFWNPSTNNWYVTNLKAAGTPGRDGTVDATYDAKTGTLTLIPGNPEARGYVSPEWFGAKGDGVADDTIPLRKAMQQNQVLLKGTYKVTEPITAAARVVAGDGAAVILNRIPEPDGTTVLLTFQNDVAASGFSVETPYQTDGTAIHLNRNGFIQRVNISGGRVGISATGRLIEGATRECVVYCCCCW